MPEMNPSVGVFVVLYKAALMGVRVYVPLPIVAVFVLVLDESGARVTHGSYGAPSVTPADCSNLR